MAVYGPLRALFYAPLSNKLACLNGVNTVTLILPPGLLWAPTASILRTPLTQRCACLSEVSTVTHNAKTP